MISQFLFQFTLVALISSVFSVELIEKDDHNNNLLPLDTSKSLWIVQDAIRNNFKFNSVRDAIVFVDRCKYLNGAMAIVDDAQYEGLARKIKELLKDEEVIKYCAVQETKLEEKFGLLDAKDMGVQVTKRRLEELVSLGDRLSKDSKALHMFGDLYDKSKFSTGNNLLVHAGEDTTTFFGEHSKGLFNLKIYETGCSISALKPICKLIRKTERDDVSALGSDVEDFIELMEANDDAKINKHVESSGVTLENLKETCTTIYPNFHAIKILQLFIGNEFVSEQMVAEQSKVDPNFYLYNQIYKLCKLSTGRV